MPANQKATHRLTSKDTEAGTGVCASCGPVVLAWRVNRGKRQARCPAARRAQSELRTPAGAARKRDQLARARRKPHGLTQAEARAYRAGKCCPICGEPAQATDHNHKTRQLRDPLCFNCNTGLGMFAEDPARLRAAADYLERWAQLASVASYPGPFRVPGG